MIGPRVSVLGRPVIYVDIEEEHVGFIISAEDNEADLFLPKTGAVVSNVPCDPEGSPLSWRFVPNEDR